MFSAIASSPAVSGRPAATSAARSFRSSPAQKAAAAAREHDGAGRAARVLQGRAQQRAGAAVEGVALVLAGEGDLQPAGMALDGDGVLMHGS
jgi:hypothetical protein